MIIMNRLLVPFGSPRKPRQPWQLSQASPALTTLTSASVTGSNRTVLRSHCKRAGIQAMPPSSIERPSGWRAPRPAIEIHTVEVLSADHQCQSRLFVPPIFDSLRGFCSIVVGYLCSTNRDGVIYGDRSTEWVGENWHAWAGLAYTHIRTYTRCSINIKQRILIEEEVK